MNTILVHRSCGWLSWMRQICKLPAYFANWKWRLFSNVHCPCREYSVGWISREKCNFGVSQAAAPTVIQQYAPPIDPKNQYVGDIFQMEAKHSTSTKLFLFFSCQSSSIPTLAKDWVTDWLMIHHSESDNLPLPYTSKLDIIWDQTTFNFIVYNLQLPHGRHGHHGRNDRTLLKSITIDIIKIVTKRCSAL